MSGKVVCHLCAGAEFKVTPYVHIKSVQNTGRIMHWTTDWRGGISSHQPPSRGRARTSRSGGDGLATIAAMSTMTPDALAASKRDALPRDRIGEARQGAPGGRGWRLPCAAAMKPRPESPIP